MTVGAIQFLIVCPLVFLAGFVDAVAGGGGLISLPAYLIAGLPVHYAIGTNKLSSGMGTAITTGRFARNGFIPWKQSGFYIISALIGSGIGASLALMLDDAFYYEMKNPGGREGAFFREKDSAYRYGGRPGNRSL